MVQPAGQLFTPSIRTQRLSFGSPEPCGTQTLPAPQLPADWSVPHASTRVCHDPGLVIMPPEGSHDPWLVTMAGAVILHESWLCPLSRFEGVWHMPSASAGVQSVPLPFPPQLVEPAQQVSVGGAHDAPWMGPQAHAVHCAGPAGSSWLVVALRLGGQPGGGGAGSMVSVT